VRSCRRPIEGDPRSGWRTRAARGRAPFSNPRLSPPIDRPRSPEQTDGVPFSDADEDGEAIATPTRRFGGSTSRTFRVGLRVGVRVDTGGFEPPTSALRKQRSSADLRAQRGGAGDVPLNPVSPRSPGPDGRSAPAGYSGPDVEVRRKMALGAPGEDRSARRSSPRP
jgi:hypothetical protein